MSNFYESCVICELPKQNKYYLCRKCAIEWGCYNVPYRLWPLWIREMVNMYQKEKYRDKILAQHETSVDPLNLEKIVDKDLQ